MVNWRRYLEATAIALLLIIAATSPATAQDGPQHIVRQGETLFRIALRYGVTVNALAVANGIQNPNRIYAGQVLIIPSGSTVSAVPPTSAPAEPIYHIVQPGEYLGRIAQRYGVSVSALASANAIADPNRIFAGQRLIIPVGAATTAATAPISASPSSSTVMESSVGVPHGPTPTIYTGKQIVVDLSDQMVYAFENGVLVHSVLVSTGLPGTPTVQGDFRIYRKLASQTMQGPGYYLPDVPWVMYFYRGYSLHGTYWHNNFGQPMSHGCVNMPTPEAQWFYNWASVGTPVHVQW